MIDASNCWVTPGIIEAHCHIGIIEEKKGFEGVVYSAKCVSVCSQVFAFFFKHSFLFILNHSLNRISFLSENIS